MASDQDRFPRLTEGLDLRSLPIGPAEAFVLSHVDGASNATEIAAAIGLDAAAVETTLTRLRELGAVRFETRAPSSPRVARAPSSAQHVLGSVVEERANAEEHPGARLYDPAELDEDVEIDPVRRKHILEVFYRLDRLSHYELLGLEPDADRRAIKTKYYEVVNVFHPDRYYGKRLGNYKAKLERIFQRLTEAHEALTRPEARTEYDAYLRAERSTQALDRQLNDEEAYARELQAVQTRIEAEARAAAAALAAAPPEREPAAAASVSVSVSRPSALPPQSRPASASGETQRVSMPAADPEARRRAFARKLGLSPPLARPASPTPAPQPGNHQRAAEDLKHRYEQRISEAQRRQAEAYVSRAEQAIAAKNVVDAVNALRIAVSLLPHDAALKSRLVTVERDAARELAERYLEQARYEEREKHWAEAARSYAQALARAPDPRVSERLANSLLNAQGDVRKAVEHARSAVIHYPNEVNFRLTLVRAYLAAKMNESALGELERASALAPSDDSIRQQIRRLKRGES